MSKNRNRKSVPVSETVVVAEVPHVRVLPDLTQLAQVAQVAVVPEVAAVPQVAEAPQSEYGPHIAPVAQVPQAKQKKYPREGGKCWVVWHQCDVLIIQGVHPTVKHLRDWAVANNQNVSNASQEFYAWRKFHGRK